MKPSPENLERSVNALLRDLPARRAPRALEHRVLAALAAREALAALPWWKKSYAHWPLAGRCAFLLLAAGVAKLVLLAAVWATASLATAALATALATPLAWLDIARAAVASAGQFGATLLRAVPSLWLYGGLAAVATAYVALFGLGATAYRTLYANR